MCVSTCQNGLLFLVFSRLFVVVGSSVTLAANVFRLAAGGAFQQYRSFGKPHFNYTKKLSTEALHPRLRQTDVELNLR
jgi:hypothetical protein